MRVETDMPYFSKGFFKFLYPPTPKELGQEHSALESRWFSPFTNEFCWEDWEEEAKRDYPVRYFLTQTIPHWFIVKIKMRIENAYWYLRDKLITKHYLLDIRQGYNDFDHYSWGYIDPVQKMLYACFNILRDYIENEKPLNLRDTYSEEEIDDCQLRHQQDHYDEAHALYQYWMHDRKRAYDDVAKIREEKNAAVEAGDEEEYNRLQGVWLEAYRGLDDLEEEMLARLVKIRGGLWT